MRVTRRSILGATALTVSMTALAACSQDPGTGGSGGASDGGGGGEQIASDQNDINPKEREEIGEGGVLRLANNAFPANWNPFHSDGNEANTSDILRTVFPLEEPSGLGCATSSNPVRSRSTQR